jgi:hypothetical protein
MSKKIKNLEEEIKKLEDDLQLKKKELIYYYINHWMNTNFEKFSDILTYNEMKVICNFIHANYLFKNYDQNVTLQTDYFYDKVCLMLDIDMKELCVRFEDLIQYFEDLDDYLTNDEIIEKINFFRDNIESVEEDNLEIFFSLCL